MVFAALSLLSSTKNRKKVSFQLQYYSVGYVIQYRPASKKHMSKKMRLRFLRI